MLWMLRSIRPTAKISSQLAEVESRELASIDLALENIRQGTYGKCAACNKSIPMARLNALPYAVLCIDCQRAAETGQAGGDMDNWQNVLGANNTKANVPMPDTGTR